MTQNLNTSLVFKYPTYLHASLEKREELQIQDGKVWHFDTTVKDESEGYLASFIEQIFEDVPEDDEQQVVVQREDVDDIEEINFRVDETVKIWRVATDKVNEVNVFKLGEIDEIIVTVADVKDEIIGRTADNYISEVVGSLEMTVEIEVIVVIKVEINN